MADQKSFLDTVANSTKPESFDKEEFVAVKDRKKLISIIIASAAAAIILIAIIVVSIASNNVKVPQLTGMTMTEAGDWALKNKITLSAVNIYDFGTDSGVILSQEVKSGKTIPKNSTLSVQVSLGANPDESIVFPDLKSMTKSQIDAWVASNKLTGIKFVSVNSDVIGINQVISYTMTDDTEANFKRKSRVTVNVSIGAKAASDTVVVTDFSSMKAGDILKWGRDNGVTIQLDSAFDEYISVGTVISQSVSVDTEIKKSDTVIVVVSLGKQITVPDFTAMSKDDATLWGKTKNVSLIFKDQYSDTVVKDSLFNQSVEPGAGISADISVTIYHSLGQVQMASYVGKTKFDLLSWLTDLNSKNANITFTYEYIYSDAGSAGKVISQSVLNDFVNTGSSINFVMSLGKKITVPDLSLQNQAGCTSIGTGMGMKIVYRYEYSTAVAADFVISQNILPGTIISDADSLTIVISLGPQTASAPTPIPLATAAPTATPGATPTPHP